MDEEKLVIIEHLIVFDKYTCKSCGSNKYYLIILGELDGLLIYKDITMNIYCGSCGKQIPRRKYTNNIKKIIQEKKLQYKIPFHKRIIKYLICIVFILIILFLQLIPKFTSK